MINTLKLLAQSYVYHPSRCAIVVAAIIIAIAGLSAVLVLNDGAKKSYQTATQPLLQQVHYQIVARAGEKLTKQDYAMIRRAGFSNAIPVLSRRIMITKDDTSPVTAQFVGLDAYALLSLPAQYQGKNQPSEKVMAQLSAVGQQGHALILHSNYADELGLTLGDKIHIAGNPTPFLFSVTDTPGMGREFLADIGFLQAILETDEISALFLVGDFDENTLKPHISSHLQLQEIHTGQDAEQLTGSFHLNLMAMALLMFVVCMFVVMNALNLLLVKRLENLRILRQLGVSKVQIFSAMLVEVVLLSLLLTPIGVFFGVWLADLLSPSIHRTLEGLYAVNLNFEQVTYTSLMAKSALIAILGSVTASTLSIYHLEQRLSSSQAKGNKLKLISNLWSWVGTFGLLAFAVALLFNSVISSFAVVALAVFAGCASIIALVPELLTFIERQISSNMPLIKWSLSDSLRISYHSKVAFCAFYIAVATNIGMNLMVDSFRQATDHWLTQRLFADAYVYTESPDTLTGWTAKAFPETSLIPRYRGVTQLNGQEVDTYSYPVTKNFQQAMLFEKQSDDVWQRFEQNTGVLISQQLALSQGLELDTQINLTLNGKAELRTVAGIYFDYGNPKGQILLPLDWMDDLAIQPNMFAVFSPDTKELEELAQNLKLVDSEARLYKTNELLGLSMKTFDQTFVITNSLNIVTLLVAAFSLVTSIIIIDLDNRKQRALMRSLGVSRKTLFALGTSQYLALSLIVSLLSVPFGIGLSWLLINLINVQAFNWSYPLIVEPMVILSVIVSSVGVMLVGIFSANWMNKQGTMQEELKCVS